MQVQTSCLFLAFSFPCFNLHRDGYGFHGAFYYVEVAVMVLSRGCLLMSQAHPHSDNPGVLKEVLD